MIRKEAFKRRLAYKETLSAGKFDNFTAKTCLAKESLVNVIHS